MRIAVCGESEEIKKAIMQYYGYRGTACYFYNYISPIEDLSEACRVVLSGYELELYHCEDMVIKRAFIEAFGMDLKAIADREIDKVTMLWQELKMHHITVLWNVAPEHMHAIECDYKVLITYDEKCRPLGYMFNDCAVGDIFHKVVDTSKHSPEEVATLIGAGLHDKMMTALRTPDMQVV